MRGDRTLDRGGNIGGGKKGLDPEICILKVEELKGYSF